MSLPAQLSLQQADNLQGLPNRAEGRQTSLFSLQRSSFQPDCCCVPIAVNITHSAE